MINTHPLYQVGREVQIVGNLVDWDTNVDMAVSLRDNNVAQKASTMFSSYSSLQYEYFHIIISLLCCV
jgi:hypothetical protein